ncbi:MAG: DUF1080 domain-containing protein [Verrucomicrobiales bacterium]
MIPIQKIPPAFALSLAAAFFLLSGQATQAEEVALFNGTDLTGWTGDPSVWGVEDGAIVGKTSAGAPVEHNTFLIWEGGEPSDFELTLKFKMIPGDKERYTNSGIQYRSRVDDAEKWIVGGYQADFEYGERYSGILYEERGRGILAQRGQKVVLTQSDDPKKPTIEVVESLGDTEELQKTIDRDGWNEYRIVARGNHLQQYINGKLMADITDKTAEAASEGVIAFQVHRGPPMEVRFKDIVLKKK